MTSTFSSVKFESKDAEGLNKTLPIPSIDSTSTANNNTPEPSSKTLEAQIIDEEGFITLLPIKAKKTASTKDPKEPEFRGKFTSKSHATEIRIGSMHSMNKRPSSSKIPTASTATTTPPNTSNATTDSHRRTSSELEQQTDKEGWTVIGLSEATLSNSTSNSMIEYTHNPKTGTNTETNRRSKKRTRPVIVFDSNNRLSWADEVIEEAEEEEEQQQQQQQIAAQKPLPSSPQAKHINNSKSTKTHTHPSSLSAGPLSSSVSKQTQKTHDEEVQRGPKNPEKQRSRTRTPHAHSKLGIDLTTITTPTKELKRLTETNRFAVLGRSVDCI